MNNQKTIAIIVAVLALVVIGFFFIESKKEPISQQVPSTKIAGFDGKNSSFLIEGRTVKLTDGVSEVEASPNSASKVTTRYFGNESYGDLNGDGTVDTAFLISEDSGGSGIFYYVVVALTEKNGYKTTNAFLVGDRISPQTTEINQSARELMVNFAERKEGEPMTTSPSVGATLFLKVTPSGVLEGLMK